MLIFVWSLHLFTCFCNCIISIFTRMLKKWNAAMKSQEETLIFVHQLMERLLSKLYEMYTSNCIIINAQRNTYTKSTFFDSFYETWWYENAFDSRIQYVCDIYNMWCEVCIDFNIIVLFTMSCGELNYNPFVNQLVYQSFSIQNIKRYVLISIYQTNPRNTRVFLLKLISLHL